MTLHCKNFCACLMAVVISFVVTPDTQAQMLSIQSLRGLGGIGTADSADHMQRLLELHIDEIDAVVDLADKQVSKLKLTAKNVSKKVFDEKRGLFRAPRGNTLSDSSRDEESFSDQDDETKTKEAARNPLKQVRGATVMSAALNHKTWKAAVNSILTEPQQTSLEEYTTKRNKRRRDVVVQYRTWEFVKRLPLRDDQIEPVAEIVDRIEGDDLVNGNALSRRIQRPKMVSADDLKEILSEDQMKAFESSPRRLTVPQQKSSDEDTTKRNKRLRDVVVQYRTWKFVKSLSLRDDQIEPVAEIVDRIEGDELVNKLGKSGSGRIFLGRREIQNNKRVSADDLKEILSEGQMKALKRLLSPYSWPLRTLENRGLTLVPDAARPTVKNVAPDSQFDEMGVKVGDIIEKVNRLPVDTLDQINRRLQIRNRVEMNIVRDGESITLDSSK